MATEAARLRGARWRENNRQKIRDQHQRWREANPEKHAASLQRWRKENPDKVRAQSARYYDHAKAAARVANRRAKLIGAPGLVTADDIRLIHQAQENICALCPADLTDGYILDHKVALSLGGSNHATDIRLLCADCDKAKTAIENTRAARAARITSSPPPR